MQLQTGRNFLHILRHVGVLCPRTDDPVRILPGEKRNMVPGCAAVHSRLRGKPVRRRGGDSGVRVEPVQVHQQWLVWFYLSCDSILFAKSKEKRFKAQFNNKVIEFDSFLTYLNNKVFYFN